MNQEPGLVQGSMVDAINEIRAVVAEPEIGDYLLALDRWMEDISQVSIEGDDRPEMPPVDPEELTEISTTLDKIVPELADEFDVDGRLGPRDLQVIRDHAQQGIEAFLQAPEERLDQIRELVVPLHLSVLPTIATVGPTFLVADPPSGSLLAWGLPLPDLNDKKVAKAVIVAGIVLATITFFLAMINIKVPNIDPGKIAPKVTRALRNPRFRELLEELIKVFSQPGTSLRRKLRVAREFLKVLYQEGILGDILREMLSSFGVVDFLITLAALIAMVITGGASLLAKAAFAITGYGVAMFNLINGYKRVQEG